MLNDLAEALSGARRWCVVEADVVVALRMMPDASFDGSLFDPPYGLGTKEPTVENLIAYLRGIEGLDTGGDFMQARWELPSLAFWKELYRVLRPGGHVLSFAGTRTLDLVALGMRAAGFQLRDSIGDAHEGTTAPILAWLQAQGMKKGADVSRLMEEIGAEEEVKRWQGYGTLLRPLWEPIVLARKPLDGTVAASLTKHGTGALNIDACRIEMSVEDAKKIDSAHAGMDLGDRDRTRSFALGMGAAPMKLTAAAAHPLGRNPPNVVLSHAWGCGLDVEGEPECVPECPVRVLDEQSGNRRGMAGGGVHRPGARKGMFGAIDSASTARGDSGGASRFFFCSKVSRHERELGCEHLPLHAFDGEEGNESPEGLHNPHRTLKPIKMLTWAGTLILPPERADKEPRRVIVPYAGAGSEMAALLRAGWDVVIGIENDPIYIPIARARVGLMESNPRAFDDDAPRAKKSGRDEPSIFDVIDRAAGTTR